MEDEQTFRKNLQDPKKRKAAYDALVKDGYDMEPYNQFETNIGMGGQQQTATAQPNNRQQKPLGSVDTGVQQPQQQAWKPSAAQMAQFNRTIEESNQAIQQSREHLNNTLEYAREKVKHPFNLPNVGIGLGKGDNPRNPNVVKGKDRFNAETGKFEPTYITATGNAYSNRAMAEVEQGECDRKRKEAIDPIQAQLNEAYAERDRLNERLGQLGKEEDKKNDTDGE